MHRTKLTTIAATLALMAGPAVALAASTPGHDASTHSKAHSCKGLSKKHVAGHPGTAFSRCVKAAAKHTTTTTTDDSTTTDTTAAGSPPANAGVCNEAQNSPRGTMDATASTDPLPPARHKSTAMPVGNGGGLTNAAANSPALAPCVPQTPPDSGGDGTGGGSN